VSHVGEPASLRERSNFRNGEEDLHAPMRPGPGAAKVEGKDTSAGVQERTWVI
jgi:hypothetical protein